jgi:hypothetical protein
MAHQPQSRAGQVVDARVLCLALAKKWIRNSINLKVIKPNLVITLSVFLHEKNFSFSAESTRKKLAQT